MTFEKEEAKIAMQLSYGEEVATQIEQAKTPRERERLLRMARYKAIADYERKRR